MNESIALHATAVAIGQAAVIIRGPSGSGKSDLALRLIDRGAKLIADDRIIIAGTNNNPIISQSEHHISSIEIRGVGLIAMDCINNVPLKLIVDISDNYQQYPIPIPITEYGRYRVACIKISPFELTATIKIEMALKNLSIITNISENINQ